MVYYSETVKYTAISKLSNHTDFLMMKIMASLSKHVFRLLFKSSWIPNKMSGTGEIIQKSLLERSLIPLKILK